MRGKDAGWWVLPTVAGGVQRAVSAARGQDAQRGLYAERRFFGHPGRRGIGRPQFWRGCVKWGNILSVAIRSQW